MLELQNYDIEDDYSKNVLKDHLINTKLTKLDKEILKKISVWDFIEGKTKGGAYELDLCLKLKGILTLSIFLLIKSKLVCLVVSVALVNNFSLSVILPQW